MLVKFHIAIVVLQRVEFGVSGGVARAGQKGQFAQSGCGSQIVEETLWMKNLAYCSSRGNGSTVGAAFGVKREIQVCGLQEAAAIGGRMDVQHVFLYFPQFWRLLATENKS